MKVLTLTQPWATLVAIGAKKIETRSWNTGYRGPLAIHAAAGLASVGGKRGFYDLCYSSPFREALEPAMTGERDIAGFKVPHIDPAFLPLGAIVATCRLVGVARTENLTFDGQWSCLRFGGIQQWMLTDQERAFGDYSPGRYAWLLGSIQLFAEPIPCKGALGLWEADTLTELAIKRQQIAAVQV